MPAIKGPSIGFHVQVACINERRMERVGLETRGQNMSNSATAQRSSGQVMLQMGKNKHE